jgi:hypothetical protein
MYIELDNNSNKDIFTIVNRSKLEIFVTSYLISLLFQIAKWLRIVNNLLQSHASNVFYLRGRVTNL